MSSGGSFTGRPAYHRQLPNFSVAADTGPHPAGSVDVSDIPPGKYRLDLTFTNFGFAYDGWLRFPTGVDIHVGGGDNPGPYDHSYSDVRNLSGGVIPFVGESTGGDDMTFSNILLTFTLETC